MKGSTLSRRLLAGAAGLAIGLGVAFAAATPAQAERNQHDSNAAFAYYEDTCEGTWVTFGKPKNDHNWRVLVDYKVFWGTFDPEPIRNSPDSDSGYITDGNKGEIFVPAGSGKIKVQWWKDSYPDGWQSDTGSHVWKNPGWPGKDCEGPRVEVVEDCDGNVTVTIQGNDTRRTWKVEDAEKFIEFGATETFDASSVDVEVKWEHNGAFKLADESYVTRTPADPEECKVPEEPKEEEEGGEGGELPKTGASTGIVIGGALALLALGGGLYLVARRRRVSFTA